MCLRLLYFNAHSVLVKLDELCVLCSLYDYHIVCVVESWLSDNVPNSEISLDGYHTFRQDRDGHGGGILIFVKSELCASLVSYSPITTCLEFLP